MIRAQRAIVGMIERVGDPYRSRTCRLRDSKISPLAQDQRKIDRLGSEQGKRQQQGKLPRQVAREREFH